MERSELEVDARIENEKRIKAHHARLAMTRSRAVELKQAR